MPRRKWQPRFLLRVATPGSSGAATLSQRQIYILPTRFGLLFALLLLAMLIGSLNYDINAGFLFTFLLGGVGLVTMLHTWRNLLGLELSAGAARPVFAGEEASFLLELHNRAPRARPDLQAESDSGYVAVTDVAAAQRASLLLRKTSRHRGEVPLGRVKVSTRFPLGIFYAWAYVELGMHCLAYPRPADEGEPPIVQGGGGGELGLHGAGTEDFVGLRGYRLGDSPRRIDWKALSRERGLFIKEFSGERGSRLWLDWSRLPDVDVELKLSLLCRFVLQASGREQSYGLRLPGVEIPPGSGESHRHRCLAALARF